MLAAEASQTRADKTGTTGSTGQNVQLVNQRKTALMSMNPGMTEDEATLQAQNDILLSKQGGNPAAIAQKSMETLMKAWQGNFDNFGKNPSPEELEKMRLESINWAKTVSKLNAKGTPTTATSGAINRGGAPGTETPVAPEGVNAGTPVESVIGRKVQGTNGFGEITGQSGDKISLRLPDGREITTTLDKIAPYIIAE
jgi:hypothetical protein